MLHLRPDEAGPHFVHIEGRRMNEDGIPFIEERVQRIGDHFVAAVPGEKLFRLNVQIIRQRRAQSVCHRVRIDLRPDAG